MARHHPAKDYQELQSQISQLKRQLSRFSTESVVRAVCTKWLSSEGSPDNLIEEVGFLSPLRQSYYILGILYTTEEAPDAKAFSKAAWKDVAARVAAIFNYYTLLFHPSKVGVKNEEWDSLEASFSAFAGFIGRPKITGTIEQYREKVTGYFTPFDDALKELLGVSATELLDIYSEMARTMQENLDRVQDLFASMHKEWKLFCDVYDREGSEAAGEFMHAVRERHRGEGEVASKLAFDRCLVRLDEIRTVFPETADTFWSQFCAARPLAEAFLHPTDRNPAEIRPIFEIRPGEALVPVANVIVAAMIERFDEALKGSRFRERYLRSRDKTLERQSGVAIKQILPEGARIYESVFEAANGHFEHDLLAVADNVALVIECKASGLREPMRDPRKAYTRIRDDFRSDKGIQKAYDQAERLRGLILSDKRTALYDRRGQEILRLEPGAVTEVFCVCVTAEDWGLLGIKLSLLLEKKDEDPYPWVVNVLDLELILEALRFRAWGWREFLDFLRQRSQLHHKIFTDDELDVAGIFVSHGTLQSVIDQKADRISVHGMHSKVFDRIWLSKHTGSEVRFEEPLQFTDLRDILGKMKDQASPPSSPDKRVAWNRVGRNDPCPCGSGRKYKRCHYRNDALRGDGR